MITILIPTRNRPSYLKEAIESVRRQSDVKSIAQVIVSENSMNENSRDVCREFSDLPITYIQQRPLLSSLDHWKTIISLVNTPLFAILFDDDWWGTHHLHDSVKILSDEADCVCVYSHYFSTSGPQSLFELSDFAPRVWIAAGCRFATSYMLLDDVAVLLACLLRTTFHYSTLVGKTPEFQSAFLRVWSTKNEFDNDRTLPVYLSEHGSIGYLPAPGVFVRRHGEQYSGDPTHGAYGLRLAQTTRFLLAELPDKVASAAARFNGMVRPIGYPATQPDAIILNEIRTLPGQLRDVLGQECGFFLPVLPDISSKTPNEKHNVKWILKKLIPPVLLDIYRLLRKLPRP